MADQGVDPYVPPWCFGRQLDDEETAGVDGATTDTNEKHRHTVALHVHLVDSESEVQSELRGAGRRLARMRSLSEQASEL